MPRLGGSTSRSLLAGAKLEDAGGMGAHGAAVRAAWSRRGAGGGAWPSRTLATCCRTCSRRSPAISIAFARSSPATRFAAGWRPSRGTRSATISDVAPAEPAATGGTDAALHMQQIADHKAVDDLPDFADDPLFDELLHQGTGVDSQRVPRAHLAGVLASGRRWPRRRRRRRRSGHEAGRGAQLPNRGCCCGCAANWATLPTNPAAMAPRSASEATRTASSSLRRILRRLRAGA